MTTPPFIPVFAVNSDLSLSALEYAIGVWFKNYDTFPSVLWCSVDEFAYADRIVDMLAATHRHLTVIPDPSYASDSWSVGTRRDKGVGSVGA